MIDSSYLKLMVIIQVVITWKMRDLYRYLVKVKMTRWLKYFGLKIPI